MKEAINGATSAFDLDEYKQAFEEIVEILNEFTDGAYETFGWAKDAATASLFTTATTTLALSSLTLVTML